MTQGIWKLATDGRVLDTITTPSQIANISYGDGALWVAARRRRDGHADRPAHRRDQAIPHRPSPDRYRRRWRRPSPFLSTRTASDLLAHLSGHVLQVRNHDWFNSTDPAVAAEPGTAEQPWEQQFQYATCAPLLGYP